MARILHINLTKREHFFVDRPDLSEKYIGGVGIASKLLLEECPQGIDAFSPENPIILATGPMTGIFPVITKTVACFKSPLTNEYGESHAGGRLGAAMRWAGLDAIVVKGKANRPAYISIHDSEVKVKNAETLWGMSSIRTVGRILREVEPGAGRRSILRIGRAGENLVRYACVNVDTVRHFGRLGLGAVFGSKNLKAMVIEGTNDIFFKDVKKYSKVYDEIFGIVCKTKEMQKYHDLGTASNVIPLNAMGALPTRNFSSNTLENAEKISGEHFAEHYLARKTAC
jgi:aldehyde:ferredoxin oxidoreductase